MPGTYRMRIDHLIRYGDGHTYAWSGWLGGRCRGAGLASSREEAIERAQELVDPDALDDVRIEERELGPVVTTGTRVYYTGDMANQPDWGTVAEVHLGSLHQPVYYTITPDAGGTPWNISDREIGRVYHGHCDPRFVTEGAYRAYHADRGRRGLGGPARDAAAPAGAPALP